MYSKDFINVATLNVRGIRNEYEKKVFSFIMYSKDFINIATLNVSGIRNVYEKKCLALSCTVKTL